ncbi:MAG: DUF4261 domain-containing protein [Ferruginibacter sp.]
MGLFSLFKKNSKQKDTGKNKIVLGMVLLEETDSMNIESVVDELRIKWQLTVDDTEAGKETSVLTIEGYMVAVGNMPVPIPGKEVEEAADYNYYWENGAAEAAAHKGHIIVSVMNGGKDPVKENLLFSKVVSSVLNNSSSVGVYIGGRTLLLKKDFFQENMEDVSEDNLPVNNLVYFGIRRAEGKNSVYTYGLEDFEKLEMEIVDSAHPMEELMEMMYNVTCYVLENNIEFRDGETVGMSAEQKLKLKISAGKYLEGKTLKIDY